MKMLSLVWIIAQFEIFKNTLHKQVTKFNDCNTEINWINDFTWQKELYERWYMRVDGIFNVSRPLYEIRSMKEELTRYKLLPESIN